MDADFRKRMLSSPLDGVTAEMPVAVQPLLAYGR